MAILGLDGNRRSRIQRDTPSEDANDNDPIRLVYGTFLHNPETSVNDALAHLNRLENHVLQISLINRIAYLALESLLVGQPIVARADMFQIPFTALLRTRLPFPDNKEAFGISAYLYYANLSAEENILNRAGLLCLKTEERRFSGRISIANWREWVDESRMYATAEACF